VDLNVNVNIQQSDGVAALGISRERLEAIAQEVAQIGGMTGENDETVRADDGGTTADRCGRKFGHRP
jgi:hypothetical protein